LKFQKMTDKHLLQIYYYVYNALKLLGLLKRKMTTSLVLLAKLSICHPGFLFFF
jgi:hypothetical protein